jgi:acyl-CoA dehydrogenase
VTRYAAALADPDQLDSLGFSLAMNTTKTQSTTLVVDVVNQALGVCGILGYREDTPYSMGRILRDAHGGAVMVANDRITANNAQLLLVHKGN